MNLIEKLEKMSRDELFGRYEQIEQELLRRQREDSILQHEQYLIASYLWKEKEDDS